MNIHWHELVTDAIIVFAAIGVVTVILTFGAGCASNDYDDDCNVVGVMYARKAT